MEKIAISPAADTSRQCAERGVTLFELLIALAILAVAAGFVGSAMGRSLEGRAFDRTVRTVADDLRRGRLAALESGEPVLVEVDEDGYRIAREAIERRWPEDVTADWRAMRDGRRIATDRFTIGSDRIAALHLQVAITRGERRRVVIMDPVTARVHDE